MSQTRYGAYAYFDKDGNLLEFISDKALRQGNTTGQNKIYIYMENTVYTGKSLQCNYKDSQTDHVYNEVVIPITTNLVEFALPTFEKYDPIHFVSGKEYVFIEVEVPQEVMADNGGKSLSLALLNSVQPEYNYDLRFASVITFYVQESVIKYTETIDKSQFEYLLALIGDYANSIVDKEHTVFVADSLSIVQSIGGWEIGQLFIVNETVNNEVHKIMYVWTGSAYNPVFDFDDYYTKAEIDERLNLIQLELNGKQNLLTTDLPTAQLQYAIGFDSQGNLRKGQGGGGATYNAGNGINITDYTISVDTDVVATKSFVSDNYATKLELENVAEIAEGKSKSYVINTQSQITGTKDSDDNYTNVTAITGITLTDLHLGDIIYIKELNVPDYWVSAMVYNGDVLESISLNKMETSKVDLDNYVDLDSNQTITGIKTFSSGSLISPKIITSRSQLLIDIGAFTDFAFEHYIFRPAGDNNTDLGRTTQKWKDLYLSGKIKDGTNEFNADNVFNVINAPASTALIPSEYAILTNGRPTRVVGTFGGLSNPTLFTGLEEYGSFSGFFLSRVSGNLFRIGRYGINTTTNTKLITFQNSQYIEMNAGNSYTEIKGIGVKINGTNQVEISTPLLKIRGKNAPDYPSDTTKQYRFVQLIGGNLDYLPDYAQPYATNSTTELNYETINNITLSADTTYTLATAPTGTYPEYKANITNSGTSAINLTFTGVSVIKTNDSNITIASNVLTLPAGTTIECSIQNGRMIAYNWSAN